MKLSTLRGSTSDEPGQYHSCAQSHHCDKTVPYILRRHKHRWPELSNTAALSRYLITSAIGLSTKLTCQGFFPNG